MLSRRLLSDYSFLAFPLAAAFITLQIIVPSHYAEKTTLSLSAIGAIMLIARLWDTVTDPIVGYLSDLTPQRFGRRRVWIFTGLPFISISVYALFNPPPSADAGYVFLWTLALYISGTMAIVPFNAWGAELTDDYNQRNRVTGSRATFGLIGTLVAVSIPAALGEAGSDNLSGTLQYITWLVIITLIIAFFFMLRVPDNNTIVLPASQFKAAFNLIRQPTPLRKLLICFLLNSMANAIPAALFLFYATYVLKVPEQAGFFLFTYFICSVISIPLWLKFSKRFGKHRTWHWSIIIACCFFMWTPFLTVETYWIYWVVIVATGFTTGCDLIIPASMNGDLVEWDAASSGYRRPGLFFAFWGMITKLAYALAIGIAFPFLDIFGFSAGEDNSTEALFALACLYGIPTILCKLGALWSMWNYPITEEEYNSLLMKPN